MIRRWVLVMAAVLALTAVVAWWADDDNRVAPGWYCFDFGVPDPHRERVAPPVRDRPCRQYEVDHAPGIEQ